MVKHQRKTHKGVTLYVAGLALAAGMLSAAIGLAFGHSASKKLHQAKPQAIKDHSPIKTVKLNPSDDDQVISLVVGSRCQFTWPRSAKIRSGGTWFSTLDTVSKSGVYSAPKAALPGGIDVVTYLEPSGTDHTFLVHVTGRTEAPIRVPSNYFERADAGPNITAAQRQQFLADENATPSINVPDDGQWHEVTDGRNSTAQIPD